MARCSTMKPVAEIGIRTLEQDARAVVAGAAAGEMITISDRGRPVAQMTPLPVCRLQQLIHSGARAPRRPITALPKRLAGPSVADAIIAARHVERS